jgi:hypothetical protein
VADSADIKRLDGDGAVVQTYHIDGVNFCFLSTWTQMAAHSGPEILGRQISTDSTSRVEQRRLAQSIPAQASQAFAFLVNLLVPC